KREAEQIDAELDARSAARPVRRESLSQQEDSAPVSSAPPAPVSPAIPAVPATAATPVIPATPATDKADELSEVDDAERPWWETDPRITNRFGQP
ncbi:MAG TPA: hypothetical protein VGD91_09910, partial [Trebonia sp.]